jgi:hypothetical protein
MSGLEFERSDTRCTPRSRTMLREMIVTTVQAPQNVA